MSAYTILPTYWKTNELSIIFTEKILDPNLTEINIPSHFGTEVEEYRDLCGRCSGEIEKFVKVWDDLSFKKQRERLDQPLKINLPLRMSDISLLLDRLRNITEIGIIDPWLPDNVTKDRLMSSYKNIKVLHLYKYQVQKLILR